MNCCYVTSNVCPQYLLLSPNLNTFDLIKLFHGVAFLSEVNVFFPVYVYKAISIDISFSANLAD